MASSMRALTEPLCDLRMPRSMERVAHDIDDIVRDANLTLDERVADRLGDLLLDTDEILVLLTGRESEAMQVLEPRLRKIYDEIDEILRQVAS